MTAHDDPALVDTGWLAAHLDAPDVRVVDASYYLPNEGLDPRAELVQWYGGALGGGLSAHSRDENGVVLRDVKDPPPNAASPLNGREEGPPQVVREDDGFLLILRDHGRVGVRPQRDTARGVGGSDHWEEGVLPQTPEADDGEGYYECDGRTVDAPITRRSEAQHRRPRHGVRGAKGWSRGL